MDNCSKFESVSITSLTIFLPKSSGDVKKLTICCFFKPSLNSVSFSAFSPLSTNLAGTRQSSLIKYMRVGISFLIASLYSSCEYESPLSSSIEP